MHSKATILILSAWFALSESIQTPQKSFLEVNCERVKLRHWGWKIDDHIMTCFMDDETAIKSTGVLIGEWQNLTMSGLIFEHNQKINYLPENISEKFPNLVGLSAYDSGVKKISKANFHNLIHLKELHLSNNFIVMINGDTFAGLISLDHVFLGKETNFICAQFA